MEIEISGHSGCKIEVVSENKQLIVYKSTDDPDYAGRLKNQARKQMDFQPGENRNIKSPHVFDVKYDRSTCTIQMEYIYSLNFIAFAENAGFVQINNFLENIIDFVDSEIALSKIKEIDDCVFYEKYADVKNKIQANVHINSDAEIQSLLPVMDRIFSKKLRLAIPVGACHGDLTLSNILFNGNRCYLIDFLDSFIETPLMDIVKLRQDTAFNWSGQMYGGAYDQVRHSLLLNFMDRKIHDFFSRYRWYHDAYELFQLMNFLRVLQYAHAPNVISFLKTCINDLIKEYEQ